MWCLVWVFLLCNAAVHDVCRTAVALRDKLKLYPAGSLFQPLLWSLNCLNLSVARSGVQQVAFHAL